MVKGINRFKEYFRDFTDQYVLIGGAACDISFESNNVDFRATKDLDVVLIVEALTREFGQRGQHVDSRDLKKHRNDIIRMASELVLERCELPDEVRSDMETFIQTMNVTDQEIINLKLNTKMLDYFINNIIWR